MVNLNCGEGFDADIGTDSFYSPKKIRDNN